MAQIQKGTTYITGDQVTAANLNALADAAILLPGAITDQTAKAVPLAADTVLIHSAADTALRKSTLTQLFANATGIPLTTGVTGILPAANGGTGVANASTLTLAGNVTHAGAFTQSFTATANTSLTLPVTGTLATLAGSEALSNKTITASSFSGTTGAFTTLSASGLLSANAGLSVTGTTQGSGLFKIGTGTFTTAVNTTGVQFDTSTTNSGIEWVASSSGSGYGHRITDIDSGAGYAAWKLQGRTNSGTFSTVLQVDGTTGLAVTGALSATGTISTSAGNITALNGILQVGSGSKQLYLRTLTGVNRIDSYDNPITATQPLTINSSIMRMAIADTDRAVLDSTGLAVTGALSSTGTLSTTSAASFSGAGLPYLANSLMIRNSGSSDAQLWALGANASTTGTLTFVLARSDGTSTNTVGTFTSTGLGIGTTSPTQRLDIATASGDCIIRLGNGTSTARFAVDSDGPYIYPLTAGDNSLRVFTPAGGTAMLIDSSGNLLVGTTSGSGNRVDIVGSNGCKISGWGAGVGTGLTMASTTTTLSDAISFDINGTQVGKIQTTSTATLYVTTSDYRRKSNVKDLTGSGAFIDSLKPRTFDWDTGDKGVGFIAHEFAEISPSSVSGEKNAVDAEGKPVYQGMQASTPEVIANLVAELQSLRQRVAALESN